MFSDRLFQVTFLVSLIAHGVILFQNSNLVTLPINKKERKLEVTYLRNLQESKAHLKPAPSKREQPLNLLSKITAEKKSIPPPFIDKETIFKVNKDSISGQSIFTKPILVKPDVIAIKKKITLPSVDTDKINNPSYISYYQIVREKIRRAAYQNYTRTEVGEVYLSFIISSDGYLKEVRPREDRSSPNPYLTEIALRSIKDASPFPGFPKELDYPQLSFNVVISFEIE